MVDIITTPGVELIGHSETTNLDAFELDSYDYAPGEAVMEFAGRECYQSSHRPNPKTKNPQDYLRNIIDQGHESVLEHSMFTFRITGVSRTFTHELVRHRHLSFSQQSQRYVDESESALVVPPAVRDNLPEGIPEMVEAMEQAQRLYTSLVQQLQAKGLVRKQAREAARAVLPNGTETRIVVTGNLRAWRDFLKRRMHPAADREICAVAAKIYRVLVGINPAYVHGVM